MWLHVEACGTMTVTLLLSGSLGPFFPLGGALMEVLCSEKRASYIKKPLLVSFQEHQNIFILCFFFFFSIELIKGENSQLESHFIVLTVGVTEENL